MLEILLLIFYNFTLKLLFNHRIHQALSLRGSKQRDPSVAHHAVLSVADQSIFFTLSTFPLTLFQVKHKFSHLLLSGAVGACLWPFFQYL